MLSLSSLGDAVLPAAGSSSKVVTGYSGDTFPNFTPNPIFAARVPSRARSRSSTGRSSRSRSGSRPRRAACPAVVDPLDRRLVDGGERRATRASTRRSARSGCSRRSHPTSRCCTRRSRTVQGNVALHPPLLEGVVGRAGGAPGRDRHRRAGRRRPRARGRTSCASPRTGCSPCARRRWARTRAACSRATSRSTGTARTTSSGSRRGQRAAATTSTRGSATGCSTSTTSDEYLARLGDDRVAALRAKAAPDSWRADEAAYPPDLDAPPNRWELAAVVRRPAPRRPGARARRRRGARRRRRRQPRGMARRRAGPAARQRRAAHGRDRAVGLRADAGRSVRPQPPQLPAVDDARRRGRSCSARSSAARARRRIACLGGAQVDRLGNINSTLDPRRPVPRGLGWRQRRRQRRGRGRRRRDAHARAARHPSAATSPRRGGRCARS